VSAVIRAIASDHFDGSRFFNPSRSQAKTLWQVFRWRTSGARKPWPRWIEMERRFELPPQPGPDEATVTFINHSTFLLRLSGLNVLTDPIWSERASPVRWAGPRRVRSPGITFNQLPPVQLVLVSHNHYDHMDLPTLRRLDRRFRPLFLTGLGNRRYLRRRGLRHVAELDWWQTYQGAALDVTMTPARHFARRGLFDTNRTLWGGFWLAGAGLHILFAGDSGYDRHFTAIRERLGAPDIALLPIGAYEPRWFMREAHLNPAEAVQAHLDLAARQSVAMHFGTFQLTDEGINEPAQALRQSLAQQRIDEEQFRVLEFGATVRVARITHPERP
jgi:L-ascorbate metabolism protein UlaG (beta-lactamase superfamily)